MPTPKQHERSNTTRKGKTRVDDWAYKTQTAIEMVTMVIEVWGALKGAKTGVVIPRL